MMLVLLLVVLLVAGCSCWWCSCCPGATPLLPRVLRRRPSRRARVSPSEEPPSPPPSPNGPEQWKRRRVGDWSAALPRTTSLPVHQRNAALMGAAEEARGLSYGGTWVQLAVGLHVSTFTLDMNTTVERLRAIQAGTLSRSSISAAYWSYVDPDTIAGVLRVLDALEEGPDGHLDSALATNIFYNHELPGLLQNLQANVVRKLGRCSPLMLVSTGATEQSLGERFAHGRRFISVRPTELLPVLAMCKNMAAHEEDVISRQLASISSLPLEQLQHMAGSTEAKKVLLAAVSHLSSQRRLAKYHCVSVGRTKRAEEAVCTSIVRMGQVADEVYAKLAAERTGLQEQAQREHQPFKSPPSRRRHRTLTAACGGAAGIAAAGAGIGGSAARPVGEGSP